MPIITVEMFEGRTLEQKREFVAAVTREACRTLDCEPSAVDIIIHDVKRQNWASAGKLWAEESP
jgi:4-oxalocrotonate tautomerase